MSEKPTVTIPDLHHVEIPTTIHAPIGGREICITTTSEYDRVNREVNIPPFHICAAPIERFVPTCSADGTDLERLDIYIDPDNALRCDSKKRFQKLLMAMTTYGRNDAAAATANNRDYWTCHGLKRSESYQLKWLRVIFPETFYGQDRRRKPLAGIRKGTPEQKGRTQMTLLDMVRDYQSLLERKEELADEVKANNAMIEEAKANISQQMIDDDCPSISTGGFKFTLTPKTIYSKKSEAELASEGINFFETLREEGLGDIIVESVNTRTLQSTIKAYITENDGLSEDLAKCISIFDTYDITRRRESSRATKGGKK